VTYVNTRKKQPSSSFCMRNKIFWYFSLCTKNRTFHYIDVTHVLFYPQLQLFGQVINYLDEVEP
jgi:hypothetical protein